jgi:hypothetical protein
MHINLKELRQPEVRMENLKKEITIKELREKVAGEIEKGIDTHLSFIRDLDAFVERNGFIQKVLTIESTKQDEWDMVMEFAKGKKIIKTIYSVTYQDELDVIIIYDPKAL